MIRPAVIALLAAMLAVTPALARSRAKPQTPAETTESDDSQPATDKSEARSPRGRDGASTRTRGARGRDESKDAKGDTKGKDAKGKPVSVGTFGDWGAFTAQSKGKTCYALAQPRDRVPATLKREAAYIFISNRPAESVRNEISIIMGFPMKDNADAKAEINGTTFDLICKGMNAWVKNAAREGEFVDAMKRGSKLVIKASALKGGVTTDSYALGGFSEALARVQKDCP